MKKSNQQEPLGICYKLFRLIMNSLAFQSLKRITLGRRGDHEMDTVPILIKTIPQNGAHSTVDGSIDPIDDLVEVEGNNNFANASTVEDSRLSSVRPTWTDAHKQDYVFAVPNQNPNGLIDRVMKQVGNDSRVLKDQVHEIDLQPMQDIKIGNWVEIQGNGDMKNPVDINGDAFNSDDRNNYINMSIDAKAERFIRKKREKLANLRTTTINESRSGAPHEKKSHPQIQLL